MLSALVVIVLTVTLLASYRQFRKKLVDWRKAEQQKSHIAAIPGSVPTDKVTGSSPEIAAAGGLLRFLAAEHKRHGPVIRFHIGERTLVSVASPSGFKKLAKVFNQPCEVFNAYLPLFTAPSITFANSPTRRQLYEKAFSRNLMPNYYQSFQQVADEVASRWLEADQDDRIKVHWTMHRVTLKAVAIEAFGKCLSDDGVIDSLANSLATCWPLLGDPMSDGQNDELAQSQLKAATDTIFRIVRNALKDRRAEKVEEGDRRLVDMFLEFDYCEDRIFADAVTLIHGASHSVGNMLTWALYYIAKHEDVQEKLVEEINRILGDKNVNAANLAELKYLRQVQDETMRCSALTPWAARYLDEDIEIDGYVIPAKTSIIAAVGVMLKDSKYWPEPDKFDPDRFNPENSKTRPAHVFSPFGLSGRRPCPGNRFAYAETAIVLVTILRKMRLQITNDGDVGSTCGLITEVSDELWVSVKPR